MSISIARKSFCPRGATIILILFTAWTACLAQEEHADAPEAYHQIFRIAQGALKHDPLLQNGIYFSYPYYNAIGHPFLDAKEFETGSVIFKGKQYVGVDINYDIFNQHIILSWEFDGILQMILLDPQFVGGFKLKDLQFIKAEFQDGAPEFFQLVSENTRVSCYYAWYKERREVRDSGNRSIFSFSDKKSRHYLELDGQLFRYKNNKSFVKLFPEASKVLLKAYLHEYNLQVMEAGDKEMDAFLVYCNDILEQLEERGGA